MNVRELCAEAYTTARVHLVPSITIALLVAAMCLTTLMTVGRTAHAEAQVEARLDTAGARFLAVSDVSDHRLIGPETLSAVAGLSGVETTLATSLPRDVVLAGVPGTAAVPQRWVRGDLSAVVTLTAGRWPGPGETILAEDTARAFGLDAPVGAVLARDGNESPVVGTYTAANPWNDFATGSLTIEDQPRTIYTIMVVVDAAASAQSVQEHVLRIIAAPNPEWLQVRSPATLADVQRDIGDDLHQFSRSLLFLVIGAGAALAAVVVLADTIVRQRDLGRRRAVGASRSAIIALVLLRTAFAGFGGVILGSLIGWWAARILGHPPPLDFTLAVAAIALLTAVAASSLPATLASFRDPVLVLRTP